MNLQLGDTGPAVAQLQTDLAAMHFPLAADGIFGPRTDDALRGAQLVVGLVPDGIFGPLSQEVLFEEPGGLAEVTVNAEPSLSLLTVERVDSVTTDAKTTVFEAEVAYPGVSANPAFFVPDSANAALRARVEHLVNTKALEAETPFAPFGPSFVTGEVESTCIAPSIIGMHGNLSVYVTGTPHPNPMPFLATMDLAADSFIAAPDLWMPGVDWPTALRDIALLTFSPGPGLAPTPENFRHQTITPAGIKVVFEAFQVAPGIAGAPSFVATWDRIESLVRPSIVARAFLGHPGGPGPILTVPDPREGP